MRSENNNRKRRADSPRHCGNCGKIGHNSRTCQEGIELDNESDSE
jgi:hypothetical protein